ncbi:MAG: chloride channel protein [Sorangiineae bacterium]|nr:chloride channel protein [Polyangiaceae bacterium]MEB2321491.1 chloride channel protein [Sorangiineae bacterium]
MIRMIKRSSRGRARPSRTSMSAGSPRQDSGELGDFTTTPRVLSITLIALPIGVLGTGIAWALLRLIGIITNLMFFGRFGTELSPIQDHTVGSLFVVAVPILGGLVVGAMARFGSDKIRGHGIPEAIEAILMNGAKVSPKIAVLKPLSSAIAIGTGGPFGAEGPIIMTGGALGSTFAQLMQLTNIERRTLLVAGAAAGMTAVFGTPVAAVLLGVEVLLFEFKPRSLIPVAAAAAVAAVLRDDWIGVAPLFPVPAHANTIGLGGLGGAFVVGLSAGVVSVLLTKSIELTEHLYAKTRLDWVWWPALGGVAVGVTGLFFPAALGVGYGNIGEFLSGAGGWHFILGILLVKWLVWALALGSGTSGGTIAPIMMVGCAVGAAESSFLPDLGAGLWPLVAMGAVVGGTFRAPFTGILFAFELTHDVNAVVPLTAAVFVSFTVTVLALRRSILTEKIARRGYHISAEYSVDPLVMILVKEVMRTNVVAFPSSSSIDELAQSMYSDHSRNAGQRLYPVLDADGLLRGVISRSHLQALAEDPDDAAAERTVGDVASMDPVVAFADEPLKAAVQRMAEFGVTRMPVVDRRSPRRLLGVVSLYDLLGVRLRDARGERDRERVLRLRLFAGPRQPDSRPAVRAS